MTSAEKALYRIDQAHLRLDRAVRCWIPTDLARISQCREILLESLRELQELESIFEQTVDTAVGPGVFNSTAVTAGISAAKVRAALIALRNEMIHLEKMVDAASAFVRGILLLSGSSVPVYTAGGRIQPDVASGVSQGMQG